MTEPQEKRPNTPFDHPLFLPVLLFAGFLWFGYDGWFNPNIKAKTFNKVGAVVLLAGSIATGVRGLREQRRTDGEG